MIGILRYRYWVCFVGICHAWLQLIIIIIVNALFCRYLESARIYAKTCASFEEVSLKFLQHAEEDNEEALRCFLSKKLEGLKARKA